MSNYIFLIVVLAVLAVAVIGITLHGEQLTNDQYDRLKGIVLKWSGIVTFLDVLVSTFHISYGKETITVVAAISALQRTSAYRYTINAYIVGQGS